MHLIQHTTNCSPVPADAWVQIDLGDGEVYVEQARHVGWDRGAGENGEGRVLAYAVLELAQPGPALHA